jgi:diadenylate cyclase
LRHRAAIGMSEVTDTLIVVVSEETGKISTVRNGFIYHNLSPLELRKKINAYLYEEDEEEEQVKPPKKAKEEPAANTPGKTKAADQSSSV